MRTRGLVVLAIVCVLLLPTVALAAPTPASVGRSLYFDATLSSPVGQSCASCHDPAFGYADPGGAAVSPGAETGRFGSRNAPTAAYAAYIPARSWDASIGAYVGGQFWDGRVDSLEEQAKGPFLNPLEMNMPSEAAVVAAVASAPYADVFREVFGPNSLSLADVPGAYDRIAYAIAEYERSADFNRFSSKHDYAMTLPMGPTRMQAFTMQERQGMMLFMGKGKCVLCHVGANMMMGGGGTGGGGMGGGGMGGGGMGGGGMGGGGMGGGGMGGMAMAPMPGDTPGDMTGAPLTTMMPLFTDHRYMNLGIPKNPDNPYYTISSELNPEGPDYVDHGLAAAMPGGVAANPELDGMFRTPTLRNVAKTAPYGHNGYFPTLKSIITFYNKRDTTTTVWPAPEVPSNIDTLTVGNLGLTNAEENALVAFLGTLTDGWWGSAPDPQAPVSRLTLDGTMGNDGWYVSRVIGTLEALDFGGGVDRIEYSTSPGVWQSYWDPILLDRDGQIELAYRAWDLAGNAELVTTETVRVDTNPPVITSSNSGATYFVGQSVRAAFDVDDAGSGVSTFSATMAEGELLDTSQTGDHSYVVNATDVAGNSSLRTVTYSVRARKTAVVRLSTTSSTLSKPGAPCTVAGTLTDEDGGVAGVSVVLERSEDGIAYATRQTAVTDASGGFTFADIPVSKSWYRVRFAGDVSRTEAVSDPITILPLARVGTPVVPSTVYGRSQVVYGSLEPRHRVGTYHVRLYLWRYVNGSWRSYGYQQADVYDYGAISRYRRSVRFPYAGRWRVRSLAPADSGHASTWSSGFDYTVVR